MGDTFTYAAIYDPVAGTITSLNNTAHDMFCAGLASTGDGRIIASGGGNDVRTTSTIGIIPRWSQNWSRLGDMLSGRWYNSSIALSNGNLLTMWGRSGGTLTEIFDQNANTWSALAGVAIDSSVDPADGVDDDHNWFPHLHHMPNGKIFMAGPLKTMRWIDYTGIGSWTVAGTRTPDGIRHRKLGASVQYLPGKILMTGGRDDRFSPSVTNTVVLIDATTDTPVTTSAPAMSYARAFHNLVVLPTGEVAAFGGTTAGVKFSDSGGVTIPEIWNSGLNQWRTIPAMAVARGYHMFATLLRDGRVLVGGGGLCDCAADHLNTQIYSPGYLFNPDGTAAARPTIDLMTPDLKPGITVGLKGSDNITAFRLIRLQATTHGINSDQRYIPVSFNKVAPGNYDLTIDPNQNILIPGMYWLFALTSNGTPSMGYPVQMFTPSTWPGTGAGETNLAKGKVATQSSTELGEAASRAVDGNSNGDLFQNSVSSTLQQTQPYWDVDLGANAQISNVRIWGRTDCCGSLLTNFHVFLSATPFTGTTVPQSKAQAGVRDFPYPGTAPSTATIPVNAAGRYVRVQLEGNSQLQLAEVELIGAVLTNTPPSVALTSPASGATAVAPASFTINATASDAEGNLAKVEFYQGSTKLGESTASPFTYTWTNVPAGVYTVKARAIDALGLFSEASVNVTVNPPANVAPAVSIVSPVDGALTTAPAAFTISANAGDTDGNLARVEFFQGATKLTEMTTAPFQVAVTNLSAGTYSFTAKATDTLGLSSSATIAVRVLTRQLQSLKGVPVPEPSALMTFVKNRSAAIALGKALFWDTQVSSDGTIACASCHFQAGADPRLKNQMNPGTFRTGNPSMTFDQSRTGAADGPNYAMKPGDFPRHVLTDPLDPNSAVIYQSKDVMGSHGEFLRNFVSTDPGAPEDACVSTSDPVFGAFRRVTGRNSPSVLNAIFNLRNFWDGRANSTFNGVDPFGLRNTAAVIYRGSTPAPTAVSLDNASLASQAMAAPTNSGEMSCAGRPWPEIGKRLLSSTALSRQSVASSDSVLSSYASSSGKGLDRNYEAMVRAAFMDDLHSSATPITIGGKQYSQIQANFSLFFGLAVQMYEATLVSDQAPIDSYFASYPSTSINNASALSSDAIAGLNVFTGKGRCVSCHHGPQLSNAATPAREAAAIGAIISRMRMGNGDAGAYDLGYYNIGVRPAAEDLGIGGADVFGNPLSFTRQSKSGAVKDVFSVSSCAFEIDPCTPLDSSSRDVVDGAFKTPSLRNLSLTGPYFHNGSASTLEDVVDFYNRGGNANGSTTVNSTGYGANATNAHADIKPLALTPDEKTFLVTFLKTALLDDRVLYERAPFDHPELPLANGLTGSTTDFVLLPSVGNTGRAQPLRTFEDIILSGDLGYSSAPAAPSVALTAPSGGSTYTYPANVNLTATATATQGAVARVEFYSNGTLLGASTAAPYSFSWSNIAAGSYWLTAKAIGTNGGVAISTVVPIVVTPPPAPSVSITSPATGSSYFAPATVTVSATAATTQGTVSRVEFYAGANLLGTATATPYSANLAGAPAGTYALTAKAFGSNGTSTTSDPVTITVVQPIAPSVALTAPANGAAYAAPATITLTATASTTQGAISQVEFYNGTTLLGADATAPYSLTWSGVTAGNYSITAKAIGSNGASTVSSAATVMVSTLSLAGRWALDAVSAGLTPDSTVNNNAGAVSGSYQLVTGHSGQAIQLDPTTGGVLTQRQVIDPTKSFSIALWVNLPQTAGTQTFVSLPAGTVSNFYLQLAGWMNGGFAIDMYTSDSTNAPDYVAASMKIPVPNQWYHVTGVYDATNRVLSMYVNGQLESQVNAPAGGFANSGPLAFGYSKYAGTRYDGTNAKIDDVQVFPVALSASDVLSVYSDPGVPAPTVSLTAPAAGATFVAPAAVTLTAAASTTQGAVSRVDFYNGATLLGSVAAAPYTFDWLNVPVGTYSLSATAIGSNGATAVSAPVSITVAAAVAPTVSLTAPTSGANFTAPATIAISATASTTQGTITQVEFYNGSTLLGTATASPYSFAWSSVPAGTYAIAAKAIGSNGASTVTTANTVTVSTAVPPTVSLTSPTSGTTYVAPGAVTLSATASTTQGTITQVEFYNGTALIATDTSSPYSFTWTNVAAGSYSITAKAVGSNGTSATTPANTITVAPQAAPAVTISAPANGASFAAPATVTITADASTTQGTIAQVEFYNGATLLATDTAAPYTFAWTGVAAGTYSLSAKATGSNGLATTSASISLTVTAGAAPAAVGYWPLDSVVGGQTEDNSENNNRGIVSGAYNVVSGSVGQAIQLDPSNGGIVTQRSVIDPTKSFSVALWVNMTQAAGTQTFVSLPASSVSNFYLQRAGWLNGGFAIDMYTGDSTGAQDYVAASTTIPVANQWYHIAGVYDATARKVRIYVNGVMEAQSDAPASGFANSGPLAFGYSKYSGVRYDGTDARLDNIQVFNSALTSSEVAAVYAAAGQPAPTVSLTSPSGGATFIAPATISLSASASTTQGTVSRVDFYNGATLLGSSASAPYVYTWSNVATGTYSLTAVAVGSNGSTATSAPVSITVQAPAAPVVTLTAPSNGSTFSAPASVSITATATTTQGTIAKVDFYNGATLLGTATSAPYSFTWSNVGAGAYSITATATGSNGMSATTPASTITVSAPAPTVTLTAPASGASFTAPATVQITATASTTQGTVTQVEFYNGAALLGTATTAPYGFTWTNVSAGSYSITAKAIGSNGTSAVTAAANISVTAPAAPTVTLTSPANGASFVAPATVSITANASTTQGTITQVEFYNGTVLLGTSTASPYNFSWTNVAAGTYTITAKAIGNNGQSATTAPNSITVAAPAAPTVTVTSPASGASFVAPASVSITATASTTQGTVSRVDFYNGATLLGTATTSPYSFNWTNVAAGSYSITATAVGSNGTSTQSTVVSITVAPAAPPSVTLTSPTNGASFVAPATITISANASTTQGAVTQVEFYNGTTLLATDTTSPFSFSWTNVAAGTYSITAKAIGSNGTSTTTPASTITVAAPAPVMSLTAPSNGATFTAPATISITATATISQGTITQVEFYNGATLLTTDTSSPYSYSWLNVPAGTYSITAKAIGSNGTSTITPASSITVSTAAVPSVSLTSPASGSSFIAPATISLAATATTTQGTITRVEFYNGSTLLASDTTSPYTYSWTNVPVGTYSITAKAIGSNGTTNTSPASTVTVALATTPAPAGRWPLDSVASGQTADISASNNAGIVTGPYSVVTGTIGQALQLDPNTGGVLTQRTVIDPTKSFTVAVWVNLAQTTGTQTFVSLPASSVSNFYLQLAGWSNGGFALDMYPADSTGAQDYAATSTTIPIANQWYHVAGVYDAAARKVRIYVNGVMETQTDAPGGGFANTRPLAFGYSIYNGTRHDGNNAKIDDVQVFSSALTSAEVFAVYTNR